MIDIELCNKGTEKLKEILVDSYLDKFVVFSLEIQLCFNAKTDNSEVWISSTGEMSTEQSALSSKLALSKGEFIAKLYELIGVNVSDVKIFETGELRITFGEHFISFASDGEDLEEVWSITSDSPEPYTQHRYSITLLEGTSLVIK